MTVHELKWLARNAAELMTLSAQLQDGGIQLELLSGPLTGIYDPNGMGSMLFAVLAVAAQLDRNYIREKTLEGLVVAAANGNHGGRPKVFDDDMTTFALALRAKGVPVPEIAAKLTIKSGKDVGRTPAPIPRSPQFTGPLPKPTTPRRCCCPGPARPIWRTTARDSGHDPRSRAPAEGRPGAGAEHAESGPFGRYQGVQNDADGGVLDDAPGASSESPRGNHLRSL
jgi:hypothetical protein